MFRFIRPVAASAALALGLLCFEATANAQQTCVTQDELDTAQKAVIDAAAAHNEQFSAIQYFPYSYAHTQMQNAYVAAEMACRVVLPTRDFDAREVQNCIDAAYGEYETSVSGAIADMESELVNLEIVLGAAQDAYNLLMTRPTCVSAAAGDGGKGVILFLKRAA